MQLILQGGGNIQFKLGMDFFILCGCTAVIKLNLFFFSFSLRDLFSKLVYGSVVFSRDEL